MKHKSILLILPYFGKWPIWFGAHLKSIEQNQTVHWLIVTDCELPEIYPSNIRFISTTLHELNAKVNSVVEANVPLTPRKFCDLKPAYGAIFNEYVKEYDFWGFCDMDIIWGDIRAFITDEVLENYDIISSRKEAISGHFNLFRNTLEINQLYKQVPNYKKLFEETKFKWFDEEKLTCFLKQNQFDFKIFWSTILLNQERGRDSHQEYHLDRWLWENGKMINTFSNKEVMYLHFINWKKTMKDCEVNYLDQSIKFYISYSKIHYYKHNFFQIKVNTFKNYFDGYYVKLWKKKKRKKVNKMIKSKL